MKKFLLAVSLFVACTGQSIANGWVYSESKDEMRDEVNYAATLTSEKKTPPESNKDVSLDIILISNDGNIAEKAGLHLHEAQYACKDHNGCDVKIRFDNGNVNDLYAAIADGQNNLLIIDDPREFIESVRLSERVIIEIPMNDGGRQQFEFSPDGIKWKGIEAERRYLSEFGRINLMDRVDLVGKDISKRSNGVICFDDNLEVMKEWVTPATICTYDGMVSFISIKAKNDKKIINKLVADINKSLGSTIKINNGIAMWLSDETLGISSIWLKMDKKGGFSVDFFYRPVLNRVPVL